MSEGLDTIAVAISAALSYRQGELDFPAFQKTMAVLTLVEQGVIEPTDEQIHWRISELSTATSFLSSIK